MSDRLNIEISIVADLVADLPYAIRAQRLVNSIREFFSCDAVGLLKIDGDSLTPIAMQGLTLEALGRRFLISQHARLASILSTRSPVRFLPGNPLPDPYDGLLEHHADQALPVHDCMGISLHLEGQLWGALTLDAFNGKTFQQSDPDRLASFAILIQAAMRVSQLEQDNRHLRLLRGNENPVASTDHEHIEIIGHSPVLQNLLKELDVVAESDLPVLLLGETGVGKELFAQRVHRTSQRCHHPLIKVNCAALPESLAESELFGHVKGAFSGATTDRMGRIEAAQHGTLFLDEVGELPLSIQAKLLRTLQNGEIQRLGEDKPRQVNTRIISATNRQLQEQVRQGSFRADLYHRLSVYPVHVPALRERGSDVLILAGRFLELNRARLGMRSLRLSESAERALCEYSWPGNVRELEHVISRAALRTVSLGANRNEIITIRPELLALESTSNDHDNFLSSTCFHVSDSQSIRQVESTYPSRTQAEQKHTQSLREATEFFQRKQIRERLEQHNGNWAATARSLELDTSNLHKLAKKLGLK